MAGTGKVLKSKRILAALLVFFFTGLAILTWVQLRQEKKEGQNEIDQKGRRLVSLISMFPLEAFSGETSKFFLRTLTESTGGDPLAYCFIHDDQGHLLVSFDRDNLAAALPNQVQVNSLNSLALIRQTFQAGRSEQYFEFSKPIHQEGRRVGTVRLGFRLPPVDLFSAERISLMGTAAFFMFVTAFFAYYGVARAFSPLLRFARRIGETWAEAAAEGPTGGPSGGGVTRLVGGLEKSLGFIQEKISRMEEGQAALSGKLGAMAFRIKQFEKILDSVNFGIIMTDLNDNVTHVNEFWLHLLNKDRAEVFDRPLAEAVADEEIAVLAAQKWSGRQRNVGALLEKSFDQISPGEVYRLTLSPIYDAEGSTIGKTLFAHNVTAEKLAERTRQEFIAHVAHELKTPLATIKSYNEMLMDGEIEDLEMKKEFYNTINDETNRLAGLINNLISLSKIQMGGLSIERGLVQTDWLFNDCLAAVEAPAYDKNITLERIVPDNFPHLLGDKEMLKVAIINILNNAVKYTPDGGRIRFALRDHGDSIGFEVADSGYGIAKDDLPHIFEQFYRSSDPHVTDQVGSGLGLSITQEIVRLHSGEIEVQSEPGQGTQFTITLPREEYQIGRQ